MALPKLAHAPLRTRLAIAVAFAALAATTADASAQSPAETTLFGFLLDRGRYTTLEAPRAGVVIGPVGINERGQTVGQYVVDDSKQSGFVRDRRGRITQFDVPGARATVASKINNRGQIVGSYSENTAFVADPNARRRGFLLDKGRFIRIDVAGALITQAFGINERGQVVGEYKDAGGRFHGFLWEKRRFTTINGPDGTGASATLLSKGVYTTFGATGVPITFTWGVNDRGQIVGYTAAELAGTPVIRGSCWPTGPWGRSRRSPSRVRSEPRRSASTTAAASSAPTLPPRPRRAPSAAPCGCR